MLPSEELALIEAEAKSIIGKSVINLHADFIKQSPVDTGAFKNSWDLEQLGAMEWKITNNAEYATILFDGRRPGPNGIMLGSDQWISGGGPVLIRFNDTLQKRLDNIKV